MANWVTRAKQTFVSSLAFVMTSIPVASHASDRFDGSFWFKEQGTTVAPRHYDDDRNRDRGHYINRHPDDRHYPYEDRRPYYDRSYENRRTYYDARQRVTPRVMRTHQKGICVVQNYNFWGNPEPLITVPCREARHYVVHRRYVDLPINIRTYTHTRHHRGPDIHVRASGGLRGGYVWKDGKRHYPIVKKENVKYWTYDNRRKHNKSRTYTPR